jgi:hypothetical protein
MLSGCRRRRRRVHGKRAGLRDKSESIRSARGTDTMCGVWRLLWAGAAKSVWMKTWIVLSWLTALAACSHAGGVSDAGACLNDPVCTCNDGQMGSTVCDLDTHEFVMCQCSGTGSAPPRAAGAGGSQSRDAGAAGSARAGASGSTRRDASAQAGAVAAVSGAAGKPADGARGQRQNGRQRRH